MKLSVKAAAITGAVLWGGVVFFVAVVNLVWADYGIAFLEVADSIYPGYHATPTIGNVVVVTLYAILDGENPIRVWREYRELTQRQLAEAAGISTPYLSQLESGKRAGKTEVLSAIADALNVTLEDIVKVS